MVVAQLVGDTARTRDCLKLRGERRVGEEKCFELRGVRGVERAKL
jgi:hypothetical protein